MYVPVAPQIIPFSFGDETMNYGESTSVTCSIHKGDLPINLSWLHNNISIGYVKGVMVSKVGKKISTVSIDLVNEEHAGTYTCLAENKAGSASFTTVLNVNGRDDNFFAELSMFSSISNYFFTISSFL